RARPRKLVADVGNLDLPAELAELGDHAPVVRVAAGRGGEIARYREHEAFHRSGPSYQARATSDSAMVMRMAASSRPSRPRPPLPAVSASRSKMYLVRNSVVVLKPPNSGMSSRLR